MKNFLKGYNIILGISSALYTIYKLDDLIYNLKYRKH